MSSPIEIEKACRVGNIDIINSALPSTKWKRKNVNGQTYLDIAVAHNQYDVIVELLKKAKFLISDIPKNAKIRNLLIANNCINSTVIEEEKYNILSLIYKLCRNNDTTVSDIVLCVETYGRVYPNISSILLSLYCDAEDRYYDSKNTFNKDFDIIKTLVNKFSADCNYENDNKNTPIVGAVRTLCFKSINGNRNETLTKLIIEFLLVNGADINKSCRWYTGRNSCLSMALKHCTNDNFELIITYLLSLGLDPKICHVTLSDLWTNPISLKWCIDNIAIEQSEIISAITLICEYARSDSYFVLIDKLSVELFDANSYRLLYLTCKASNSNSNEDGNKSIVIIDHLVNVKKVPLHESYLDVAISMNNYNVILHLINGYGMIISEDNIKKSMMTSPCDNEKRFKLYCFLTDKYFLATGDNYAIKTINVLKSGSSKHPDSLIISHAITKLSTAECDDAFDVLCKSGNFEIAKKIPKPTIKYGLLSYICKTLAHKNLTDTVNFLLNCGCDVNEKINDESPLHVVCRNSQAYDSCIELLISHGANMEYKDVYGKTPYDYLDSNSKIAIFVREGVEFAKKNHSDTDNTDDSDDSD